MRLNIAPRGRTPGEKFLRSIGMVVVFAAVAYAFWLNTQNTMERLQARNALWDETGIMNKQELDYLKGFTRSMRERFGVKTVIQVRKTRITPPEADNKEVFIGLCPPEKQIVLQFPGLIRHALGPDFIAYLRDKHFKNSFSDKGWISALQTAVAMIWEKLVDVETEAEYEAMENDDSGSVSQEITAPKPETDKKQE